MKINNYFISGENADEKILDSLEVCRDLLNSICKIAELNILERAEHRFTPQGLSVAFVLAESHIAFHSWPENGSYYIMLSSCKKLSDTAVSKISVELNNKFGGSHKLEVLHAVS